MAVVAIGFLEGINSWQKSPETIDFGPITSRSEGVSVYGQTISKMHDGHGELWEMFCADKALELAANLGLEVIGGHIFWEGSVFSETLKDFCIELCLVRWWKWRDDLLYHSALTIVVKEVSCVLVDCVPWQYHGACDSLISVLAYTGNGSWGVGINPGGQGSIQNSLG